MLAHNQAMIKVSMLNRHHQLHTDVQLITDVHVMMG